MRITEIVARVLVPEEFELLKKEREGIELEVNSRVADILFKMDPFEPLLKKYNIIFSEEWHNVEDKLDPQSQIRLFAWAAAQESSTEFKYITNWIRNTQGNATMRKANADNQWFFGRAMVASITLFVEEIGRLSSRYRDMMQRPDEFDTNLAVE